MDVLDLYCGAGGAATGLYRAGFDYIHGIDIKWQHEYPFVFAYYDVTMIEPEDIMEFDFIWASPPCQAYTWSSQRWNNNYPDLVETTRKLLKATGKPYVIENVINAPVRKDLMLCGEMFGLGVIRHRIFEIEGFHVPQLRHRKHKGKVRNGDYCTVAGHGGDGKASLKAWQEAMDIDWITDKKQLAEAVPPAYSKYIGECFLNQDELSYNKQEKLI